MDFVSSIFMPVVPALSGAGVLKAFLALPVVFHIHPSRRPGCVSSNIVQGAAALVAAFRTKNTKDRVLRRNRNHCDGQRARH